MNCPNCQSLYQDSDKYCPGCGGLLTKFQSKTNACVMCDASLPEGATHCAKCGSAKNIRGAQPEEVPVEYKSPTAGNIVSSVGCLGVVAAILIGCSAVDADPSHDAAFVAISYMLISVFAFGILFLIGLAMRSNTKRANRQRGYDV